MSRQAVRSLAQNRIKNGSAIVLLFDRFEVCVSRGASDYPRILDWKRDPANERWQDTASESTGFPCYPPMTTECRSKSYKKTCLRAFRLQNTTKLLASKANVISFVTDPRTASLNSKSLAQATVGRRAITLLRFKAETGFLPRAFAVISIRILIFSRSDQHIDETGRNC
jgi:hypothetical protein